MFGELGGRRSTKFMVASGEAVGRSVVSGGAAAAREKHAGARVRGYNLVRSGLGTMAVIVVAEGSRAVETRSKVYLGAVDGSRAVEARSRARSWTADGSRAVEARLRARSGAFDQSSNDDRWRFESCRNSLGIREEIKQRLQSCW